MEKPNWQVRMERLLDAEREAAKVQQDRRENPDRCNECGRYVGNMQSVVSYDPTICSESCAERRTQQNRKD